MLKVLFILGRYLPEKSAGIENYTHWLAKTLVADGHVVDVGILNSESPNAYTYEGINVVPFGEGIKSFIDYIVNYHYDVCHFQELSGLNGINIGWIRMAKKYCNKVYFTFHLPYLTCYKNDFRYFGIEDCNNFSSIDNCMKCIIATRLNYEKVTGWNLKNSIIRLMIPLIEKTPQINNLRNSITTRKKELEELLNIADNIFIFGRLV